jgi:hypothetical protein
MALDATPNGSSADSYVSVSDADAYHATHLYATTWTASTEANKEIALKMATRILDEKIEWVGAKTSSTQALAWGRTGVTDDGFTVSSTIVPQPVKNATAEFARHLLAGDLTGDAQGKGLTSLEVGDISLTFDKNDTAGVMPSIVQEMLRGWGSIHARAKFGTVSVVRT